MKLTSLAFLNLSAFINHTRLTFWVLFTISDLEHMPRGTSFTSCLHSWQSSWATLHALFLFPRINQLVSAMSYKGVPLGLLLIYYESFTYFICITQDLQIYSSCCNHISQYFCIVILLLCFSCIQLNLPNLATSGSEACWITENSKLQVILK